MLNTLQQEAFDRIIAGENLFVTGPGGAGKSYLIRTIVETFMTLDKRCAVTAITGCAAILLNCQARTLHGWAGIGLGTDTLSVLIDKVIANRRALQRWRTTDLLIIDEISMLLPELFYKLDLIGQHVRNSTAPFGGIQLMFTGDFCQLPPIHGKTVCSCHTSGTNHSASCSAWKAGTSSTEKKASAFFAFQTPLWNKIFGHEHTIILKQNMRQVGDPLFQAALTEIRFGICTPATQLLLRSAMRPLTTSLIKPTQLFSTRADAENVNRIEMAALGDVTKRTYAAKLSVPPNISKTQYLYDMIDKFDEDAQYDPYVELAVGAQVMLVSNLNIEKGLVNGARGVVIGFTDEEKYGACKDDQIVPVVQFLCCSAPVTVEWQSWEIHHPDFHGIVRSQIPLRIAWAITIHKSQGATLDCASINIGSRVFEFGQAYVALSRVKSLAALEIKEFVPTSIRAHPDIVTWYSKLEKS